MEYALKHYIITYITWMQRDKDQRTCTLRGSVMEMTESETKTNRAQTANASSTTRARVNKFRSMYNNKRIYDICA